MLETNKDFEGHLFGGNKSDVFYDTMYNFYHF